MSMNEEGLSSKNYTHDVIAGNKKWYFLQELDHKKLRNRATNTFDLIGILKF